ncbi:MAG: error-prone DNA polymerase, partial [Niveispirillum sp.]|nr:error-prone DNA polymerase [Niveispirillum sp.]
AQRRRRGDEPVSFPKPELEQVLKRTLGVPLFQEQAMRMAIVAAGFSPGRADQLRRAMATFKKTGGVGAFEQEFIDGMIGRGYEPDYAARCFKQIQGFGSYGFPESHAVSFALLAYKSSWLKCHHPAIFACALLNSQPMGFYQPAQIIRDAVEHRVEVRPVDINRSEWECTLEEGRGGPALRLGFSQVKGMREDAAIAIARERGGGYDTIRDLWRRTSLPVAILDRLADADVFASLGQDRRQALWEVKRLGGKPLPLFQAADQARRIGDNRPPVDMGDEPEADLPQMTQGEQVWADYRTKGLSLRAHPLALLRATMTGLGMGPAKALGDIKPGSIVSTAGLVLVRQRPGTASGVIFVTLEDETGIANLVVWPSVLERFRRTLMTATLMGVRGRLQRDGEVIHVVAEKLFDLSAHLHTLNDGPANDTALPDAIPAHIFGEGRNFH